MQKTEKPTGEPRTTCSPSQHRLYLQLRQADFDAVVPTASFLESVCSFKQPLNMTFCTLSSTPGQGATLCWPWKSRQRTHLPPVGGTALVPRVPQALFQSGDIAFRSPAATEGFRCDRASISIMKARSIYRRLLHPVGKVAPGKEEVWMTAVLTQCTRSPSPKGRGLMCLWHKFQSNIKPQRRIFFKPRP